MKAGKYGLTILRCVGDVAVCGQLHPDSHSIEDKDHKRQQHNFDIINDKLTGIRVQNSEMNVTMNIFGLQQKRRRFTLLRGIGTIKQPDTYLTLTSKNVLT